MATLNPEPATPSGPRPQTALDPFAWFESFDDSVMHDSLEDDVADDLDDMDDMEAVDIFSNPLEGGGG